MNMLFQPYSKSLDDHVLHLKVVFDCLMPNQFYLKKFKCTFAQPSIEYLGHILSRKGVGLDPEKIRAMTEWPLPIEGIPMSYRI